jgi:hypothetical protein
MDYEQGLERLKQLLHGTAWEPEFLTYEARLRENLADNQQFGPAPQTQADRARIVNELNRLASQVGTNFNHLCLNSLSESIQPDQTEHEQIQKTGWVNNREAEPQRRQEYARSATSPSFRKQTTRKRILAQVPISLLIALLIGIGIVVSTHLMQGYTSSLASKNVTATAVQHSASVPVIVYANQGWQNTLLNVSPGEIFNIHVSGSWTYWKGKIPYLSSAGDPNYTCGRTESSNLCGEPAPSLPEGRLIARVQPDNGKVYDFGKGPNFSWSTDQHGTLQLGINDVQDPKSLSDNSGTMDVTFTWE